jgi:hypothetical protein
MKSFQQEASMPNRKNLYPLLLTILVLAGFLSLSSCSKKPKPTPAQVLDNQVAATRTAIDKYVEDETRADELLDLLEEVEGVLAEYNSGFEDLVQDFREAYTDYGSTREELESLMEDIKASTRETRSRVLDLHFRMRDLTTEDEWKKIVKYEADAIRASRSVGAGEGGSDGSY